MDMIYDLKILNGNLELPFNEYTYSYTVKVKEDVTSLEFSYKLAEDTYVEIKNNELKEKDSIVTLDVYNVNNDVLYTFYVSKESSEDVSGIENYMHSLEVKKDEEINVLNIQLLSLGVFFLITFFFALIFKKSKKT